MNLLERMALASHVASLDDGVRVRYLAHHFMQDPINDHHACRLYTGEERKDARRTLVTFLQGVGERGLMGRVEAEVLRQFRIRWERAVRRCTRVPFYSLEDRLDALKHRRAYDETDLDRRPRPTDAREWLPRRFVDCVPTSSTIRARHARGTFKSPRFPGDWIPPSERDAEANGRAPGRAASPRSLGIALVMCATRQAGSPEGPTLSVKHSRVFVRALAEAQARSLQSGTPSRGSRP